jgi:hypothetical protein
MNLLDLASSLELLDDEQFIAVRQPWSENSDCLLVPVPSDLRFPEEARAKGFEYFLEVQTAKEVCEVFDGRPVTPLQKAQLLVFYAQNDAFPDWAYDA